MIIGKPKLLDNYICVYSDDAIKLSEIGFIPMYRSLTEDSIYFNKTEDLCKVVIEWNLRTK